MADKLTNWMPLYIGDYLRDTMHLTAEEHGIYLLLIMGCWQAGGRLPSDERHLAAVSRVGPQRFRQVRPTIAKFFEVSDGWWTHHRVLKELRNSDTLSAKRRESGAKGARARWGENGKQDGKAIANASQNDRPLPLQKKVRELNVSESPSSEAPTREQRVRRKREGSRIAANWQPTEADIAYATERGFDAARTQRTAEVFRNYWLAQSGTGAVKADWPATWRNWVLKDIERHPIVQAAPGQRVIGGVVDLDWI